MPRAANSASRIATVFFLVLFCVLVWFVAPLFLPVWKWRNLDFAEVAAKHHRDESKLKTEFDVVLRFRPRGNNYADPLSWQIVTMKPEWNQVYERQLDEDHLLVRCALLSDRSGEPPSEIYVGASYKDRYFRAKVWRLPPGALGFGKTRPVVVYQAMSFEKMSIGEAQMLDVQLTGRDWEDDDLIAERDDGWDPAAAPTPVGN